MTAGKKIYLVPEIIIYHEGGASHDESIKNEMELYEFRCVSKNTSLKKLK